MKLLSWSTSIALSALLFVGCDTVGSQEMTKPKFIVSQTGNTTFVKGVKMEKNTPSDFFRALDCRIKAQGGAVNLTDVFMDITAGAPVGKILQEATLVVGEQKYALADAAGDGNRQLLIFNLSKGEDVIISPGRWVKLSLHLRFAGHQELYDKTEVQAMFSETAVHKTRIKNAQTGESISQERRTGTAEGGTFVLKAQ